MQKNLLTSVLVAAGLLTAVAAHADEGQFMVRARAVSINFDNGQSGGLPLGGTTKIEADDRWIPEVDVSYFFTPNIAAELVLTYPQRVDITATGLGNIGNIKALPPSLLLQYHVTQFGAFKPYVGLGLNYTLFGKRNNLLGGAAEVDKSSFGPAAQIGFDYMFTKNWGLNVDVKYIKMETDVKISGSKVGTINLDPITAGVGVTYRF